MLAARLNELEHRMETRFERMGWGRGPTNTVPAAGMPVTPVTRAEAAEAVREREHATAEEARQAQLREEERLRDERIREERQMRRDERAADRPTEQSGWRKWF
jgi:hypothetical protein